MKKFLRSCVVVLLLSFITLMVCGINYNIRSFETVVNHFLSLELENTLIIFGSFGLFISLICIIFTYNIDNC